MSEQLNIEDFSKHLNTKFKIYRTDEEAFEAELVGVYELRHDHILHTFAVEFQLPLEFGVEQRIFKIEHAELGTMELFLVPVWKKSEGYRYEAIFNYLVEE